jgi:hypothetical protein
MGFSALALRAAFEVPGFVSGLDDLAMMGEPALAAMPLVAGSVVFLQE